MESIMKQGQVPVLARAKKRPEGKTPGPLKELMFKLSVDYMANSSIRIM